MAANVNWGRERPRWGIEAASFVAWIYGAYLATRDGVTIAGLVAFLLTYGLIMAILGGLLCDKSGNDCDARIE